MGVKGGCTRCPWRSVFNGLEASMVMQWIVNPPPSGTTGSIPVQPTKSFALLIIMVVNWFCNPEVVVRSHQRAPKQTEYRQVVCHSLWERDFESSILSTPTKIWGCSSIGRAGALQALGSGFKSCHLHQILLFLGNS